MSRLEASIVAVLIGSLFGLAILVIEPPAWMGRLFAALVRATDAVIGSTREWFHRGRHHMHAPLPARPFERERITVAQLAHRIERERANRLGFVKLTIVPDVEGFARDVRFAIEQLDAGRGIADQTAGIAG